VWGYAVLAIYTLRQGRNGGFDAWAT